MVWSSSPEIEFSHCDSEAPINNPIWASLFKIVTLKTFEFLALSLRNAPQSVGRFVGSFIVSDDCSSLV